MIQRIKTSVLAIGEICRFRVGASLDNRKFYLFEVLALHASSLFQPLLGVRKYFTRNDLESERNSMRLVWFTLEMECLDELRVRLEIFFRNSFGNYVDIIRDTHDLAFSGEGLVDFVAVSLIHSDRASFLFIVQLCLFDERCNQVFNGAILGN